MAVKIFVTNRDLAPHLSQLVVVPNNQGDIPENIPLNIDLVFGYQSGPQGEIQISLNACELFFRGNDCSIVPSSHFEHSIPLTAEYKAVLNAKFGVGVQNWIKAGISVDVRSSGAIEQKIYCVERHANNRWRITNLNLLRGYLVESYLDTNALCRLVVKDGAEFSITIAAYPKDINLHSFLPYIFPSEKVRKLAKLLTIKGALQRFGKSGPYVLSQSKVGVSVEDRQLKNRNIAE